MQKKHGKSELTKDQLYHGFVAYGVKVYGRFQPTLTEKLFAEYVSQRFCDKGWEFVLVKRSGGSGFERTQEAENQHKHERDAAKRNAPQPAPVPENVPTTEPQRVNVEHREHRETAEEGERSRKREHVAAENESNKTQEKVKKKKKKSEVVEVVDSDEENETRKKKKKRTRDASVESVVLS